MKKMNVWILCSTLILSACPAVLVSAEETGIVSTDSLNVRSGPSTGNSVVGKLSRGTQVTIISQTEDNWYQIEYTSGIAFVSGDYVSIRDGSQEEVTGSEKASGTASSTWDGPVLTKNAGVVMGPSGKETYYNLNMSGIIDIMRSMGNTDEYWIREDGCKMLGDYIMCAANLSVHPRGTLVESSLGTCIVCDTGGFAAANPYQLDIAVNW